MTVILQCTRNSGFLLQFKKESTIDTEDKGYRGHNKMYVVNV